MGLATPGSSRYQIQFTAVSLPSSGSFAEYQLIPDDSAGIALVANTKFAATSSAGGTTPAIDTTGATLIVVWISADSPGTFTSDSKGNVWVRGPVHSGINNPNSCSYYICKQPTIGAGHTFTCAGNYPVMFVAAFSGTNGKTTVATDSGNNYGSGITTALTPPLAPRTNQLLIAAIGSYHTPGTVSVDSGFALIDQQTGVSSQHYSGAIAYLVAPSTTVVAPTWTFTASTGSGTTTSVAMISGKTIAISSSSEVGRYRKPKFINPVDYYVTSRFPVYLGSGIPPPTYVAMSRSNLIANAYTLPSFALTEITGLPTSRQAALIQEFGRYRKARGLVLDAQQFGAYQTRRFINIEGAFAATHFGGILNVPIII